VFLNQAWLCAEGMGMPCCVQNTGMLRTKYICRQHMSVTDFTAGGKRCLNSAAVPSLCASRYEHHLAKAINIQGE